MREFVKQLPGVRSIARRLRAGEPSRIERIEVLADLPLHRGVGAEVGVHLGDFSETLLAQLEPEELHLIDPWQYQDSATYSDAWYGGRADGKQPEMDKRFEHVQMRFASQIADGIVMIHRKTSEEALSSFPDNYFDWIYIDGNHLYDYVRRDISLGLKKTKPGGYVLGDDYSGGGWWKGGVKQAVDEISTAGAAEFLGVRHSQFVFRVR